MKRMLMVATLPSMIGQFNMNNIYLLQNMGYKIDVACDFNDNSVWPEEKIRKFAYELNDLSVNCIQLNFSRNPFDFRCHSSSYREIIKVLRTKKYEFIHTHTPIASAIVRMAAHITQTKVVYTAHGFHFYDGASIKNWVAFYPIEKFLSRWTEVLITINKEDYNRAKAKFHAKKTVYIPGVGINTKKYTIDKIDKTKKRRSLGVKDDDFLLLSVGELSERKNQKIIIDALYKMKEEGSIGNIVYIVVGKGNMQKSFERLIIEYGLQDYIKLLGFRTDIDELCKTADCFVHPSIREGLGIAPLEAMASGLAMISANVNGMKDYTKDGVSGCCIDPTDVNQMVSAIKKMHDDKDFRKKCAIINRKIAKNFDIQNTEKIMKKIYEKF